MARFKKRVVGPGDYLTPDGGQRVDAARIRHWHDTIGEWKALGIKPPASWGHAPAATPHDENESAYWSSRYVAGKVTGSEIDPVSGDLVLHGDAPGVELDDEGRLVTWARAPDGNQYRTAIEEVSIGAMDWTDGTGRLWKDAPVHLALTPLPVWVPEGGQPPFEPVPSPSDNKVAHFGMGNLLVRFGGPPMAEKDDKGPPKKEGDGKKDGGEKSDDGYLSKVLELLATSDIPLPDDTTAENILERLYVALTAKGGDMANDEVPLATPPATEAAPGAFMSTIRDPLTRHLAMQLEANQRKERLGKLESLAQRGLAAAEVKTLREEITKARFALTPTGDAVKEGVDEKLQLLDRILPKDAGLLSHLTRDSIPGARELEPPEGQSGPDRYAKIADEQVRASGGRIPARKGA